MTKKSLTECGAEILEEAFFSIVGDDTAWVCKDCGKVLRYPWWHEVVPTGAPICYMTCRACRMPETDAQEHNYGILTLQEKIRRVREMEEENQGGPTD